MIYVNAHTHRAPGENELAVVNLDKDLQEVPERGYFSAGIHPWFIRQGQLEEDFQKLRGHLGKKNVVALGECGLDRVAKTPWQLQADVFIKQLELAAEFDKPVIIHNVRAGSDLIPLKRQYSQGRKWLLHGFHGSRREGELFLAEDCYFGFGRLLFNPSSKAADSCKTLPLERILPETDDSGIPVSEVLNAMAGIREMDIRPLAEVMLENFRTFFSIKQEFPSAVPY